MQRAVKTKAVVYQVEGHPHLSKSYISPVFKVQPIALVIRTSNCYRIIS